MARLMFDSDSIDALRNQRCNESLVATYADLLTQSIVNEFGSRLVVIDRALGDPLNLATVADIEAGADSIARAVALIEQWSDEGREDPTVYHDRAIWPQVDAAMTNAGLDPWNWVATLDGTLNPDNRYPAAVQALSEFKAGWHVDVSVVWLNDWHSSVK